VKLVAIDGGGIRGIIPALVLAEIEARTRRPIAELADLIAGTSTGGILACALTVPGEDGRPRHSAQALCELYRTEGPKIFHRSLWRIIESADGLIDEKHDAGALEDALRRYLGDARLGDALTRVLVTSYDLESRTPFFFKSWRVDEPGREFPMRVVARATAAAPTYFEPELAQPADGSAPLTLVDGGVFATNPSMCAYAEAQRLEPGSQTTVVSLGTGQLTKPIHYEQAKDWGLVEWVRPVIDVVFDGVSDTVDYQLHQLLAGDYTRLQTVLERASDALDDASERNLELLSEQARELIERSDAELDRVCAVLTG
jgi:patatin-like phospholipase/acyl hydrolase